MAITTNKLHLLSPGRINNRQQTKSLFQFGPPIFVDFCRRFVYRLSVVSRYLIRQLHRGLATKGVQLSFETRSLEVGLLFVMQFLWPQSLWAANPQDDPLELRRTMLRLWEYKKPRECEKLFLSCLPLVVAAIEGALSLITDFEAPAFRFSILYLAKQQHWLGFSPSLNWRWS